MELINKNIVNNRYFKVVDKVIRDILHKRKKIQYMKHLNLT